MLSAASRPRSGHGRPDFNGAKPRRLRTKEDVDLEVPLGRHERVERPRCVADHADGEVLRPGRDSGQGVAALRARQRRAVDIRQRNDGTRERRTRIAVPHRADDGALHGKHNPRQTRNEAHRTLRDATARLSQL